ncbi:hypothetical protein PRIEUP_LOCUS454 [Pristimantis euphronides]
MENTIKLLLVFVLATRVNARPPAWTFLEANPLQLIAEAIDFYNGESHSGIVFKLYKDEYEYKVGPGGQRQANFTIKETLCQKSENQTIESCEFKLEGLEKFCTASKNNQEKAFSVVCTRVAVGIKEDPVSGYMESPRNPEDNHADQSEDETSYEDHIITMEDYDNTFLEEEDAEEKRIIDAFLASKSEISDGKPLIPRTTNRNLIPGQFLARFYCLECFFDVLPRK